MTCEKTLVITYSETAFWLSFQLYINPLPSPLRLPITYENQKTKHLQLAICLANSISLKKNCPLNLKLKHFHMSTLTKWQNKRWWFFSTRASVSFYVFFSFYSVLEAPMLILYHLWGDFLINQCLSLCCSVSTMASLRNWFSLIHSWRRSVSYSNQLQSKSMNWFLYDRTLRHERVNLLGNSYIHKHLLILKLESDPQPLSL